MRDYEELVAKLRSISECEFDDRPWETVKEAADAIEELKQNIEQYKLYLQDAVNDLRSAHEKEPKWISAEDALPEVDQPVMICAFGKSVGEGVYRGHDGFHHVWKMYSSSGTYWDDEVTHYMPLPEPPKEDADG